MWAIECATAAPHLFVGVGELHARDLQGVLQGGVLLTHRLRPVLGLPAPEEALGQLHAGAAACQGRVVERGLAAGVGGRTA